MALTDENGTGMVMPVAIRAVSEMASEETAGGFCSFSCSLATMAGEDSAGSAMV